MAFDECFGGEGVRVVVGGHGRAVRAHVEEGEQVATGEMRQWARASEEVGGLADGAGYVGRGVRLQPPPPAPFRSRRKCADREGVVTGRIR